MRSARLWTIPNLLLACADQTVDRGREEAEAGRTPRKDGGEAGEQGDRGGEGDEGERSAEEEDYQGHGGDQGGFGQQASQEGGGSEAERCVLTGPLTVASQSALTRAIFFSAEKIEDAKARAAVKAQIEADKKARAAKAAAEKAAREGRIIPEAPSSSAAVAPSKPAAATPGADRKDTRLQIRMANPGGGGPYTTTLPSDSSEFLSNAFVDRLQHAESLSMI